MNTVTLYQADTQGKRYRVSITLLLCIFVLGLGAGSPVCNQQPGQALLPPESSLIRLNQIGFYPDGPKIAVVPLPSDSTFELRRLKDQALVFQGKMSAPEAWSYAGEVVRRVDFSAWQTPGEYYLVVPDLGRSASFRIATAVHQDLFQATAKSFYYLRCSTPLEEPLAGPWHHGLAHSDREVRVHPSAASATRPAGTLLAAPKGWYDAGDYGKYTPTATFATWEMLHLYETFPSAMEKLILEIPENKNALPDLLDEARWSLDFLLQMQEPTEGFVYHKLTTVKHARKVMPEADTGPRFVIGKGTAAALSFAAVMAQASRVYRPFQATFADSCLAAARKAWRWGRQNPDVAFENPADIFTGVCKDNYFLDDRNWAGVELYLSTGEDSFLQATINLGAERLKRNPTRSSTHALPYFSLLLHPEALHRTGKAEAIRKVFFQLADRYRDYSLTESAYRVPIGLANNDFNWGSNGRLAGMGTVLVAAWHHSGDLRYRKAALGALDYLLGRNALSMCFVTGAGHRSPQNIHHRPSYADGVAAPVPGFVAGGPQNIVQADRCTYPNSLPALRYLDDWCSFTTNEVAVNWNGPLLYLIGGLEAGQGKK